MSRGTLYMLGDQQHTIKYEGQTASHSRKWVRGYFYARIPLHVCQTLPKGAWQTCIYIQSYCLSADRRRHRVFSQVTSTFRKTRRLTND